MNLRLTKFIENLENGCPEMENGCIVFSTGLFNTSTWYRLNNKTGNWEWSFDLVYWNSVYTYICGEGLWANYKLDSDNKYIANYLRLKSSNNNIKQMTIMNKFIDHIDKTYKKDFNKIDNLDTLDNKDLIELEKKLDLEYKELCEQVSLVNNSNKFYDDIKTIRKITKSGANSVNELELCSYAYKHKLNVIDTRINYLTIANTYLTKCYEYILDKNLVDFLNTPNINYNLSMNKDNPYYKAINKYQNNIIKQLGYNDYIDNICEGNSYINEKIKVIKSKLEDEYITNSQNFRIINNLRNTNQKLSKEIDRLNDTISKLQLVILNSEDRRDPKNSELVEKILELERENKVLRDINSELMTKSEDAFSDYEVITDII
jgi:hypothetical protein